MKTTRFSNSFITALHAMQTRSSPKNSVCPSVRRVDCDKTEERSVQNFIPYEITFSLVFWVEEWLAGATHSTLNFGSTGPRWSEIADFQPIFARSASAAVLGTLLFKSADNLLQLQVTCWKKELVTVTLLLFLLMSGWELLGRLGVEPPVILLPQVNAPWSTPGGRAWPPNNDKCK